MTRRNTWQVLIDEFDISDEIQLQKSSKAKIYPGSYVCMAKPCPTSNDPLENWIPPDDRMQKDSLQVLAVGTRNLRPVEKYT